MEIRLGDWPSPRAGNATLGLVTYPFIAAFFGCLDYVDYCNPGFKEGLHALIPGPQLFRSGENPSPIAIWEMAIAPKMLVDEEFEVFDAIGDNPDRLRAQRSVFTMLNHKEHIDIESYLQDRGLAGYLTRFELNGWQVGHALASLDLMNITYAALFPDITGAAIHANTAPMLARFEHAFGLRRDLLNNKENPHGYPAVIWPKAAAPGTERIPAGETRPTARRPTTIG